MLSKHRGDIIGKEVEEKVFNEIRRALEHLQVKSTIVISGWKQFSNIKKQHLELELDFIIIAPGLIFHIEVKRTCDTESKEKGLVQLQNGLELIQSNIPFSQKSEWKYIRSIYFEFFDHDNQTEDLEKPCQKCRPFVLGPGDDFAEVWKSLVPKTEPALTEIGLNCLKFLLCSMFLHKEVITNQQVIDYTEGFIEDASKPENIIFWTKEQFEVLFSERQTRVAFISQFGTGKTTLLKARARLLLEQGCQVVFIIFSSTDDEKESLLVRGYRQEFTGFTDKVYIYPLNKSG